MFRNQYDNDVTVWSPQGRLHQVEYAMEAVKQGSATVGLKNRNHVVLVALKRAADDLATHQKKIINVDEHLGLSMAGLSADARKLSNWMRVECLNQRYAYHSPLPINRLIQMLGNKMQMCTQRYDRRPYGVGLLVAGYDEKGPHLYQTCPSANYFDCKAMAIGGRSQSARTYLERHLNDFLDSSLEELIKHGLRALRDTLPNELELNSKNCSLAIVGKGQSFKVYENEEIAPFLEPILKEERRRPRDTVAPAPAEEGATDQPPTAAATQPEGGATPQDPPPEEGTGGGMDTSQ
ncbi:unnamed protein product [Cyprideis torosa]|uniref:Proteasome subunit alpha type n=1 Tax=Cyprideis torosa TaxID=163714 RepID=A0A7R8WHB8_9CRUS|nr:unnamed protein product [Cyprideis torosa]CAG0894017.1 unnamed protein product [Cyprideis torosa]